MNTGLKKSPHDPGPNFCVAHLRIRRWFGRSRGEARSVRDHTRSQAQASQCIASCPSCPVPRHERLRHAVVKGLIRRGLLGKFRGRSAVYQNPLKFQLSKCFPYNARKSLSWCVKKHLFVERCRKSSQKIKARVWSSWIAWS